MINLKRSITRDLELFHHREHLIAKFTREGVYLKAMRQRWSGAYLLPWAAAYDTAVKMRVAEIRKEKTAARRARR